MKRKINFIPAIIILGISAAVFWLAPSWALKRITTKLI